MPSTAYWSPDTQGTVRAHNGPEGPHEESVSGAKHQHNYRSATMLLRLTLSRGMAGIVPQDF